LLRVEEFLEIVCTVVLGPCWLEVDAVNKNGGAWQAMQVGACSTRSSMREFCMSYSKSADGDLAGLCIVL